MIFGTDLGLPVTTRTESAQFGLAAVDFPDSHVSGPRPSIEPIHYWFRQPIAEVEWQDATSFRDVFLANRVRPIDGFVQSHFWLDARLAARLLGPVV